MIGIAIVLAGIVIFIIGAVIEDQKARQEEELFWDEFDNAEDGWGDDR